MIKRLFERPWLVLALLMVLSACGYAPEPSVRDSPSIKLENPATWPESIRQAATDPSWATEVAAKLRDKHITTGKLHFNSSGYGYVLESGRDDAYQNAKDFYIKLGVIQPVSPQVAEHVEAKAARLAWDKEKTFSVLVINNPRGVCGYASKEGCVKFLPKMLAPRTAMVVWHPQPEGGVARKEFSNP